MRTARQISAQAKALRAKLNGFIPTTISDELNKKQSIDRRTFDRTKKPKITIVDAEGFYVDKKNSYKIINANGYTVEQLSTELPEKDYYYVEQGIKIPLNYGMGVEVIYDGKHYIFQRNGNWGKAVVTVDVTTWRGLSFGAMHYYGKLQIKLPEMTQVNEERTLSSNFFIPMYENHNIELTQVLEQWEIDKYPETYRYNHAGDRHRGFYTKKQVIDHAKLMFEQIFEKGWEFKIEEN
jgi:hypothetical protein